MALLLCDLDDTLVERADAFERWLAGLGIRYGIARAELDRIRDLDDHGRCDRREFVAALARRLRVDAEVPQLLDSWRRDFAAQHRLLPETERALSSARAAGWKIGVVSNGQERMQLAKLDACAIYPVLDAVCVSEEIGAAKPSLQIFAAAANRARDVLTGGWMIGDNPEADIAGGRGAGLHTAWLRRGRRWSGPGREPDLVTDTFAEAVALILARRPAPGFRPTAGAAPRH